MSQRDFSIEALNKIFELPKNYENYRNFYDYVLKPAITEINAKSDLWVSEPEIIGKGVRKLQILGFILAIKAKKWEMIL
ncbi:TPA: replication initiation protein [Campylobacter jejuni]|nr:replication initiation protein [Campylobacter jejuni]HDZ5087287.1 replication initiation protein [Campylobacter jejuni]HDZ5090666.1 replication initiation protein [Campylobacter jejuni]HDZ5092408.1 replication initiation protein [Campylobacter jejuni]HDZ5097599.1 replication initiation protein [Campylobacter jejuni]